MSEAEPECKVKLCNALMNVKEAESHCRVKDERMVEDLPKVKTLWSVDEKLGGWGNAQPKFFDGGVSFTNPAFVDIPVTFWCKHILTVWSKRKSQRNWCYCLY